MADKATSPSVIPAASKPATTASNAPKKAARATSIKPRTKPAHPKTGEMVNAAIGDLKERGGSSLQAIKKYIAGTYKVDSERQATFIRKYLKAAVTSGILIQTKGKGAAGSFKLAKADATKPKAKPAAKPKTPKKGKQALKKTATPKKIVADSGKKTTAKKTASAVVGQKKKVSMGPAAKPPKARTTKAKPAAKSPAKISKPTTAKKNKALPAKPKKVTAKKAVAAKK